MKVTLSILAILAILAFGAAGPSAVYAEEHEEEKNNPRILCLESGCIKTFEVPFKGGETSIRPLGGLVLSATDVQAAVKGCEATSGTGEKDTSQCKDVNLLFKGFGIGISKCQSEGVEPGLVLMLLDLRLAAEQTSTGTLQPLLLAKVLNVELKPELLIKCGVVKLPVKGTFGCLLSPGLVNIPATKEVEILCKVNLEQDDPETGSCVVSCTELTEDPFLLNVLGFEDAWMLMHLKGKPNKDIFIDD